MSDDVLGLALSDPRLGHRALGALLRCLSAGRVLSARELSESGPDGRTAMGRALSDLSELGYLSALADRWGGTKRATPGEAGGTKRAGGGTKRATSGTKRATCGSKRAGGGTKRATLFISTSTSASDGLDATTPTPSGVGVVTVRAAGAHQVEDDEEYVVVGWDGIFEGPKSGPKDPARWTSADIARGFRDRVNERVPSDRRLGQAGVRQLTQVLGHWIREGLLRPEEGPALLEAFWADPANLERLGFEPPLWQRFLSFVPRARSRPQQGPGPTPEQAEAEIAAALSRLDAPRRRTA